MLVYIHNEIRNNKPEPEPEFVLPKKTIDVVQKQTAEYLPGSTFMCRESLPMVVVNLFIVERL